MSGHSSMTITDTNKRKTTLLQNFGKYLEGTEELDKHEGGKILNERLFISVAAASFLIISLSLVLSYIFKGNIAFFASDMGLNIALHVLGILGISIASSVIVGGTAIAINEKEKVEEFFCHGKKKEQNEGLSINEGPQDRRPLLRKHEPPFRQSVRMTDG